MYYNGSALHGSGWSWQTTFSSAGSFLSSWEEEKKRNFFFLFWNIPSSCPSIPSLINIIIWKWIRQLLKASRISRPRTKGEHRCWGSLRWGAAITRKLIRTAAHFRDLFRRNTQQQQQQFFELFPSGKPQGSNEDRFLFLPTFSSLSCAQHASWRRRRARWRRHSTAKRIFVHHERCASQSGSENKKIPFPNTQRVNVWCIHFTERCNFSILSPASEKD